MTTVELEITALAAGGDGVGRDAGGRVTFVPRAAPGDRLRARIVHATSSFARAELAELIAPGPTRVDPPCPHFLGRCGGCQWQHVTRAAQELGMARSGFYEALKRFKLEPASFRRK